VKNAAANVAKGNLKTISTAAQAFRVKTGAYPADLPALVAGGDIAPIVQTGVAYTFAPATGTATATESADVFGGTAANETITYSLTTGAFGGTAAL
jgi:hypothetical protein